MNNNIQNNKKIGWNFTNLYRGIKPPMLGIGLEKSIVFGTYETSKRFLKSTNINNTNIEYGISGAVSGFAASFVVTPIERMKILLQTNNKMIINKSHLNVKFLYRGLGSTFTREMPGFTIYFSMYEKLKKYYSNLYQLNSFHYFLFGGTSGLSAWLFIYPQDLLKSRIQASSDSLKISNIIQNIYKTDGIKGFFKGFNLALLRAVPLHAGTFTTVEFLKKKFPQNW